MKMTLAMLCIRKHFLRFTKIKQVHSDPTSPHTPITSHRSGLTPMKILILALF
jgi:hypothetical protein